ncbi:SGNH/GDSL hydrolase family protein [Cohnella hashimotonis]|uniref:GDSL-type esterase/lipase family protein n=1 Tax=Cohnella hashimotonis TaxID=2826895 RepID=A0ABT6TQX2_9BACL|nr:GDSL-type esterase/lipase family protein [Cohnella hashimotonis]MDI4649233.1 GDSL-type esterase/lipase family protein [Cohnella hashimotonis]
MAPTLIERLQEKRTDAGARAVLYVALGDSVTQGCMQFGATEYDHVYHAVCKRELERRCDGAIINVINSGASGDTIAASRVRWDRDVFPYKPDLVTILFGHNDAHGGEAGLKGFAAALDELVSRLRAETEAVIVLITPCMMMRHDNANIAAENRQHVPAFLRLAEEKALAQYVACIRGYAARNGLLLVDAYAMWERMEENGADIHARLSNGINHPDAAFHIELGEALAAVLLSGG